MARYELQPTLAIASIPGDFGLDSMAGALLWADANDVEIVYDGSGLILPGQDNTPIGAAIAASGANLVFVTTTPTTFAEVYGTAVASGFEALWSGEARRSTRRSSVPIRRSPRPFNVIGTAASTFGLGTPSPPA